MSLIQASFPARYTVVHLAEEFYPAIWRVPYRELCVVDGSQARAALAVGGAGEGIARGVRQPRAEGPLPEEF